MRLTSSPPWTKSSPYPLFNLAKGVNDDSPVLTTTVPIPFTRNLWPPRVVQDESVAWESFKNSLIKYAPSTTTTCLCRDNDAISNQIKRTLNRANNTNTRALQRLRRIS